jgi:hypothetical protein
MGTGDRTVDNDSAIRDGIDVRVLGPASREANCDQVPLDAGKPAVEHSSGGIERRIDEHPLDPIGADRA